MRHKNTDELTVEEVSPGKRSRVVTVLNVIVFILLFTSTVFSIINICVAPGSSSVEGENTKSSYVLMLLQSILGLVVLFLPSILERKLKVDIPTFMEIVFLLFLYGAIFLGEVREYYTKFHYWDTLLHTISGCMIGMIGFSLINILNKSNKTLLSLSPAFVAVFAFCFAMALDTMWELYEFFVDELMGTNMQKFVPPGFFVTNTKDPLPGDVATIGEFFRNSVGYKYALRDTMMDIVVDFIGAASISIIGYISLRVNNGFMNKILIKRLNDVPVEENIDETVTSEEEKADDEN